MNHWRSNFARNLIAALGRYLPRKRQETGLVALVEYRTDGGVL